MKIIPVIVYCGLLCLALSTASLSGQDDSQDNKKKPEKPVTKYSGLKKSKAVSTGDKIYTWIDQSGNRIYSDIPQAGAELMKIEEGTNYTPLNQSSTKDYSAMKPKVVPTEVIYTDFAIISPANDQTIRNNNGDFQVAIDVRPKLGAGHKLRLEMDGKPVQNSTSTFVSLANVDRGTHSLIAYIEAANGKTIKTSKPVIIHLHRARN